MSGHGTGDAPGGKPPAAAKSRAKSAARPAAAPVARIAAADVEAMALALPGAASGGHFSARDVRVSGRIFASLPADGGVVVRLTADQQAAWSTDAPGALAPIASRFAPHGWTRADPARLGCQGHVQPQEPVLLLEAEEAERGLHGQELCPVLGALQPRRHHLRLLLRRCLPTERRRRRRVAVG